MPLYKRVTEGGIFFLKFVPVSPNIEEEEIFLLDPSPTPSPPYYAYPVCSHRPPMPALKRRAVNWSHQIKISKR